MIKARESYVVQQLNPSFEQEHSMQSLTHSESKSCCFPSLSTHPTCEEIKPQFIGAVDHSVDSIHCCEYSWVNVSWCVHRRGFGTRWVWWQTHNGQAMWLWNTRYRLISFTTSVKFTRGKFPIPPESLLHCCCFFSRICYNSYDPLTFWRVVQIFDL